MVDVDTSDGFSHSPQRPVFAGGFLRLVGSLAYEISDDGERVLMFTGTGEQGETEALSIMKVVVNWFEELRAMGLGGR